MPSLIELPVSDAVESPGSPTLKKSTSFVECVLERDVTGIRLFLKSEALCSMASKIARGKQANGKWSFDTYSAPPLFRNFSGEVTDALISTSLAEGVTVNLTSPYNTNEAKKLVNDICVQVKSFISEYTSATRISARIVVDEAMIRWPKKEG